MAKPFVQFDRRLLRGHCAYGSGKKDSNMLALTSRRLWYDVILPASLTVGICTCNDGQVSMKVEMLKPS